LLHRCRTGLHPREVQIGRTCEIAEEDHQENMRGKLKKAMYGVSDAAQNWELEYTELMVEVGFTQGSHSACVFYHNEKSIRGVVHGDDCTALGSRAELDWLREVIQRRTEVKFKSRPQRRRPGAVRILKRIVTVAHGGLGTSWTRGTQRS
jgi:hypothetical protein